MRASSFDGRRSFCYNHIMKITNDTPLAGKRFKMTVLGCRVNLYESEAIASSFEARGAELVDRDADVEVVVSCAITGMAEAKCRKAVRRIRRGSPRAIVAVCGCWAQIAPQSDLRSCGADIVVGGRMKHALIGAVERAISSGDISQTIRSDDIATDESWDALSLDRPRAHTRAFIKVQDGCSMRCSYCIVPDARGRQVSRDPAETVAEVERVAASGCREVVLTGIHLGSYRWGDAALASLVGRVAEVDGISRIRLGSIEPFAVDGELLDGLAACGKFCEHLHMPLQSGDDSTLAAMRRGYTAAQYAAAADAARRTLGPRTHISADLMVGFPGESDEAFERSLAFAAEAGIGRIHVFPFSPRPGTPAAEMRPVPASAIRERTDRALAFADELHERFVRRYASLGADDSILVERVDERAAYGWSRGYIRAAVSAQGRKIFPGTELSFYPKTNVGVILLEDELTIDTEDDLIWPATM